MTHSNVRFQVGPASVPSIPSWMAEVAAVAHILSQTGIISAIEDHVQFARARFGTYDTIDFVVVLFSYALRSEERRVGKECRSRVSPYDEKEKSEYIE